MHCYLLSLCIALKLIRTHVYLEPIHFSCPTLYLRQTYYKFVSYIDIHYDITAFTSLV